MPSADAALAARRFQTLEEDALRSQRARLVRLFHEGKTTSSPGASKISTEALRDFHRKLGAHAHRVVVVTIRR
jgi:hypothetical protein